MSKQEAMIKKVNSIIQPQALRTLEYVSFSGGRGTDVWEMLTCSMKGDLTHCEKLLQKDPLLANCTWGYFTPLHFAVREGHADLVRLLLEHGADATNKTLGWQDDPLTKARDRSYAEIESMLKNHLKNKFRSSQSGSQICQLVRQGQVAAILRELDTNPDLIHASDERGNTSLHWAVLTRQLWLIDELLQRGADLQARRADGSSPVHLAIDGGDYWFRAHRDLSKQAMANPWFLVGYLTARGADYDIWTAAAVGDSEHIMTVLRADPLLANAINSAGRRPLSYAAKHGYTAAVKVLLEHGADPNAEEAGAPHGSALWNAVNGNYVECAALLLEYGANPEADLESSGNPLSIAIKKGYSGLTEMLYEYGASLSLDQACWLGKMDIVSGIVNADRSLINSGGDYGPLCMAAGFGHTSIVKLLVREGADLNAPWYANNYMGYASDTGPEMVRLLLESGADPNVPNWLGVTYLHKAAWRGNTEYASLLLKFGADINAIDDEYCTTPLGWAAKYGKHAMVRLLLDMGANPRIPEAEPWARPLAWAERYGHHDIADLLRCV